MNFAYKQKNKMVIATVAIITIIVMAIIKTNNFQPIVLLHIIILNQ